MTKHTGPNNRRQWVVRGHVISNVHCPSCGQPQGEICLNRHGYARAMTHQKRDELYNKWRKVRNHLEQV